MSCIIVSKETAISLLEQGKKMTHKHFAGVEYIREFDKNHYEWGTGSVISKKDFWDIRPGSSWNIGWFEYKSPEELTQQKPSLKVVIMGGPGAGKTTAALLIASALKEVGFSTVIEDPDVNETSENMMRVRVNKKVFMQDLAVIETANAKS